MVIVKLVGGLGNQMFQYAFGRNLALKNNSVLKLDISHYDILELPNGLPYRNFALTVFEKQLEYATRQEIDFFRNSSSFFQRGWKKIKKSFSHWEYIKEPNMLFNPDLLNLKGNYYLEGYWQSEKYFKEIEQIIRTDFTIKSTLDNEGKSILEKIKSVNSVCLNIRRQELASVKFSYASKFVGAEYITKATDWIAERVENPHFFIFSDELEWVKQNIKINYNYTIVEEHLYGDNYRDCLYLMTQCRHFIIPNSSFGWWAAWLSTGENKMVITPEKWFSLPGWSSQDLIPEAWIKI